MFLSFLFAVFLSSLFLPVGDPGLRSVQHVVVAVETRHRGGGGRVASISGLRQAETAQLVSLREGTEPRLLLFGGREVLHGIAVEGVVDAHNHSRRRAAAADFFHRDGVAESVETRSAVFGRYSDAHQPELSELLHGFGRKEVLPIPQSGVGREFRVSKVSRHLLHVRRRFRKGVEGAIGRRGDRRHRVSRERLRGDAHSAEDCHHRFTCLLVRLLGRGKIEAKEVEKKREATKKIWRSSKQSQSTVAAFLDLFI